MALGINSVSGIAGSFIGLVAGGLLAAVDWHLIFYVSVPIGVAGTLWAYLKLREVAKGEGGQLDQPGNILLGAGLIAVLVGITYALQPYGGSTMGWGNPLVLGLLIGGAAMLAALTTVSWNGGPHGCRIEDVAQAPSHAQPGIFDRDWTQAGGHPAGVTSWAGWADWGVGRLRSRRV